jgi:hypothetical protein
MEKVFVVHDIIVKATFYVAFSRKHMRGNGNGLADSCSAASLIVTKEVFA